MTKTIVITSGKGGVGKTNISVNTALELAKRDYRTCLFDADFGLANVDIILGLHPEKTLNDVIYGDKNLEDIILHSEAGIDIIPGSSGIEKIANLTSDKISELVSAFSQLSEYDYFLIDTSSGISKSVISFCLAGTETFVVITSEATSLIDAYSLIKVMAANGYQGTVKILVNKCPDVPTSKRTYVRFKKAVDTYLKVKIAFAGIVLLDPYIETALKSQDPVLLRFPDSVASQCIRSVVSILLSNKSLDESSGDFGDFWKKYFELSKADLSTPKDSKDAPKASSPQPAVSKDALDKAHVSNSNTPPGSINNAVALNTSPPSNDASQKNNTKQPPPPDISENKDDKSSNASKEGHTRKDDSEGSPILYRDKGSSTTISRIFPEMTDFPSPLPILSNYLRLQGKGAFSPSELTEMFTCDPALMVKFLRISGTSKQRRGQRLKSIHQKLQEAGPELLSSILTETSLHRAFHDQSAVDTRFVDQFWHHSYNSALIARHIASTIKYPYPDEAFLAGLIHDSARFSLQNNYPELYNQFHGSLYPEDQLLLAETKAFGRHHAEMGAAAIRDWQLNSFISDAVQYHTEPAAIIETAFDLVKIVYFASKLAYLIPEKREDSIEHCISLLPLSSAQLQDCISRAEQIVEQTAAYYEIPLTREIDTKSFKKSLEDFRNLAVDYSLLQGILPSPVPKRSLSQIITRIHQGLSILFGIQKAICLLPDKQSSSLQAVGYSDCWAEEILSDISISFQSSKSFILEAFSTSTLKLITENDPATKLSLGDKQLFNYFGSNELVCIPMVESGESLGIIILGLQKNEFSKSENLQSRLEQFGAQSAKSIRALEQIAGFSETSPPLPSSTQMRDVKNDLFG